MYGRCGSSWAGRACLPRPRNGRARARGASPGARAILMRKVRGAVAEAFLAAREARSVDDLLTALGPLDVPLERARGRIDPAPLLSYAKSREVLVRLNVTSRARSFQESTGRDDAAKLVAARSQRAGPCPRRPGALAGGRSTTDRAAPR